MKHHLKTLGGPRHMTSVRLPLVLLERITKEAKKQKTTKTKVIETILINHYFDESTTNTGGDEHV